jgi:hypothetical protein
MVTFAVLLEGAHLNVKGQLVLTVLLSWYDWNVVTPTGMDISDSASRIVYQLERNEMIPT